MKNQRKIDTNKQSFNALPDKEKILILTTVASWAPSSHNTQPWHFCICGNKITVSPDFSKSLPVGDKNNRQLYISVGTTTANICLAADCLGLGYKKNYLEKNNIFSVEIAFETLQATSFNSQLWRALSSRHSNRLKLQKQNLSREYFEKVGKLLSSEVAVRFIQEERLKNQIKKIVGEALESSFDNKEFRGELSRWIKCSSPKYSEGMPGYYLGVPWMISFIMPWAIRNFNISKMQKKMHSGWIDGAPVVGIITAKNDNAKSWILAGEFFGHMATLAESLGIRTGVMAAPIESDCGINQLQTLLNVSEHPLMFFRQGFGSAEKHFSPRRPLNELITYELCA